MEVSTLAASSGRVSSLGTSSLHSATLHQAVGVEVKQGVDWLLGIRDALADFEDMEACERIVSASLVRKCKHTH